MTDQKRIRQILDRHYQSHLLAFWGQLDASQKQNLLSQLQKLDFDQIDCWVADYVKNPTSPSLSAEFGPAPSYPPAPVDEKLTNKYRQARQVGCDLIAHGKIAGFVVAGGQGTRLGFDGPKGDFPVSPVKNKTLFQIFAETIIAASDKYKAPCPWYIMTSSLNHQQTLDIFRANDYYGLDPNDVVIFQQGTNPNFDLDGKILLADKDSIACSPDGHGGSLKALFKTGALDDMKKRGIEFISYWQIDNPLVNIFDPLFIGLHSLDNSEMSSKALIKSGPFEKVGNFCLADGKVTVIEYSDLPDDLAEKRKPDGSLLFELGSIAIHIISTSFVERLNASGFALPIHRAVKKIPYVNQNGEHIEPDKPNGVKLETFIFDALPLASNSIILQTIRTEEFAPTKNATGPDSVETTRALMVARAADWLESAGVAVPSRPDKIPDCVIEIAPAFALSKDDLRAKLDKIPSIKPGDKIYLA